MDTVKKFYEALTSDNALRERAGKLDEKYKTATPDESAIAAEIVAFAKNEGYEFSAEELKAYAKAKKELPDDELQAVAGGVYQGSCLCVMGGGGKDGETGRVCGCVFGGSGKCDNDGRNLFCMVAGGIF